MTFGKGFYRRWRTLVPIEWEVGKKGSGNWITIPEGREFENSVPWWGRWFISPDDPRWLLGAVVHDYVLEEGIEGRPQAAAEWYDGVLAGGVPEWKAKLAFVAVAAWAVYGTTTNVGQGPERNTIRG